MCVCVCVCVCNILRVFRWDRKKRLTARRHDVGSFKKRKIVIFFLKKIQKLSHCIRHLTLYRHFMDILVM